MDRIASRIPKRQKQAADLAFWLSRPMAERIAAVEALRLQAVTPPEPTDSEVRMLRVCRIAPRKQR